ncbi:MAG: peptidylprolyl isomerase [Patescibacteria group bacterium]
MKKFLLAVLMMAMFPSFAMAQVTPTSDVDPAGTSISSCVSLTSNMRYRMRDTQTNGGVSVLQDFLNTKGFLGSEPTGFFGIATLKAVKDYQSSIGLSPTGYVGPLTRAKINASCGGGESTTTSGNFPAGCSSTSRYSVTTGKSCLSAHPPAPPAVGVSYVVTPTSVQRGSSYVFAIQISGAPANSPIYFYLQGPDGLLRYAGYNIGQSTNASGSWLGETKQFIPVDGQNGTWISWVTVGNSVSPKQYHQVSGTTIVNTNNSEMRTVVTMVTNRGAITLELFNDKTPKTVENFIKLAKTGFYNGTRFHRVIKGFMFQGGDPLSKDVTNQNSWGTGGPGYVFADEIYAANNNVAGTIAMANSGPNTNGSQFFINTVNNNFLDSKHTVFGRVAAGMEAVTSIENSKTGQSDRPLEDIIIHRIDIVPSNIPAPTVTLFANPSSLTPGSTTTLKWSSVDATSCTASGGWTGNAALSGVQTLSNLTATSTYTLTCTGAGGTVAESVTVMVAEVTSVSIPAVTSFTVIDSGKWAGSKSFLWTTSGASTVDFIIDCASGLNIYSTYNGDGGTVFPCGVTWNIKGGRLDLEMIKNTTSSPITIRASVRAVGSSGYNPAAKNLSLTIPPAPTSISVISPNGGEVIDANQQLTVSFKPVAGKRTYINLASANNAGHDLLSFNNITNLVGISSDKQAVALNLPISWINSNGSDYKIEICSDIVCDKSDNYFSITSTASIPTIEIIGTPTLSIGYDSTQKESVLVAKYTVKITAGSQTLSLPSAGNGSPVGSTLATTDGRGIGAAVSVVGSTTTIPSGSSATYSIELSAIPNQILAGSYYAKIAPYVYSFDPKLGYYAGISATLVGNFSTNTVAIIGERAPYIKSVSLGIDGSLDVSALRLASVNNTVSFNGKTAILPASVGSDGTWFTILTRSQFGTTTPGTYPLQISTTEGASNVFNVNITQ